MQDEFVRLSIDYPYRLEESSQPHHMLQEPFLVFLIYDEYFLHLDKF